MSKEDKEGGANAPSSPRRSRYDYRKVNVKGRSTGQSTERFKRGVKGNSPKACGFEQWAWVPLEILESPAWRGLSVNGRKLIDRLLIEHLHQGGRENGVLIVTHGQFQAYGLTASRIKPAIEECEVFGLVRYIQGGCYAGSNSPNRFRLTWMFARSSDGETIRPSHEWRRVTQEQTNEYRKELKMRRKPTYYR